MFLPLYVILLWCRLKIEKCAQKNEISQEKCGYAFYDRTFLLYVIVIKGRRWYN